MSVHSRLSSVKFYLSRSRVHTYILLRPDQWSFGRFRGRESPRMIFKRPHVAFPKMRYLGRYLEVVAFSLEWLIVRLARNVWTSRPTRRVERDAPQLPKRYFRQFFFVRAVHVKFHVKLRNVIRNSGRDYAWLRDMKEELENGWRGKTIKQRHGTRRRPLALASSRGRFSSGDVIFLRAHSCRRRVWVADSSQEPRVVNLVRRGGRGALYFPARTKSHDRSEPTTFRFEL